MVKRIVEIDIQMAAPNLDATLRRLESLRAPIESRASFSVLLFLGVSEPILIARNAIVVVTAWPSEEAVVPRRIPLDRRRMHIAFPNALLAFLLLLRTRTADRRITTWTRIIFSVHQREVATKGTAAHAGIPNLPIVVRDQRQLPRTTIETAATARRLAAA
jgi:hypothetical protein